MAVNSRTSKSARNSIVALGIYIINLILQFFSRKVFFDYLGADVLGLNTTVTNLLQFLNLAEMGIGTAVAYTLYKPLFDNDEKTIDEIISLQGWLYRKIAYFIIGGSIILMAFFPLIFSKIKLPLWYAYGSFIALLISAILGYFVNYKQVLLSADQKEYKIGIGYKLVLSFKVLFQIIAIRYFSDGYVWWLFLEVFFTVIASLSLNVVVKNEYPHLTTTLSSGRELSKKHLEVTKKIKQLFFHKIGSFVLTQSSPLVIYAYTSLTIVAVYGNYSLIILGCTTLLLAVFNGMNASVGNLVSQGDFTRIINVFNEFFSIRFYVSTVISIAVFFITPSFITFWIGREYILDQTCLILMIASMFIQLMKSTIESFTFAYGLFSDVWAPIAEAIINISLSITLGYFYGLQGILMGVLISLFLMVFIWKPIFLFWKGFKINMSNYWISYIKHILIACICYTLSIHIYSPSCISTTSFLPAIFQTILFSALLFIVQALTCNGLRCFIRRIIRIVIHN